MAAKQPKKPDVGAPKFPYTTEPKSLNRLLTEIPKRPKPPKVTMETLKSWNVSSNNNARTAIRVLRTIGLLDDSGAPLEPYVEFMKTGTGPAVLGRRVREAYRVLFENSLAPQNESADELRKLFNIHSGGSDDTLRLQVQTFKVLAEHASFDAQPVQGDGAAASTSSGSATRSQQDGLKMPPIQVDLHIHLPENKTSRDYEAIIQDIARYIYGRNIETR